MYSDIKYELKMQRERERERKRIIQAAVTATKRWSEWCMRKNYTEAL